MCLEKIWLFYVAISLYAMSNVIKSIQKFQNKSVLIGAKSPTSISESSFYNGLKRFNILGLVFINRYPSAMIADEL